MKLQRQEIQAALEALQPGQLWIQPLFRDGEKQGGIDVGCDETGCLVHYWIDGVAEVQQLHKTTASAALMVYEEALRWDLDEPYWILETHFKNMKTFQDLEFKTHPMGEGVQAILAFDNGYAASVVRTPFSYGGGRGLYELAIFRDGSICYDTPITNDVIGYLKEEEVTEVLCQIQEL